MADRIKNYQQEADQITTLKAIRTDLGVTPSSYTPDATVVTKDRVVTFAQAEEELVVLSDIEKGVKQQVVKGDIADKRITNIEKLLQGNLYDYQTDTTSAYKKSVPSGAMPYAGLEKLGGKTIVWNQLADTTGLSSQTSSDVNITLNNNGSYTISGTASGRIQTNIVIKRFYSVVGHKYLVHLSQPFSDAFSDGGRLALRFGSGFNTNVIYASSILECTTEAKLYAYFDSLTDETGTAYSYTNIFIDIHDLTLMFGAGNEPSTVAEFESMFPASYYSYNAGTLLSAGVTEVVSKDSNNATLQTYPIPTAIRNLEGYGWSAGTAYNYVDFERKVFVKNVGSRAYASGDESDSTVVTDMTTTYYPLTTAVETDISAYLTDDNLIQVEAGSTLTFPNSNGTDYQIPVPSAETYMINLQEAVSNG